MPKRSIAFLLICLGALVFIGSAAYLLSSAQINTLNLPQTLADLPLVNANYGPEAVAEINRLHGKQFEQTTGAMGTYRNALGNATLWVSQFPGRAIAQQIVDAMRAKIAEGNSPFTPSGAQPQGNRTLYSLDGMGQKHFFFQSNDLVIWLAVDPAIANQALRQTLEVYP
jgi:hypothetical protein